MEAEQLMEVEPGLRACLPVSRLTHSPHRCILAYYLQPTLSADGQKLLYFEFDSAQVDRRRPDPMRGQIVVADPDGSNPEKLEMIDVPSPSSGAQAQWCGTATYRIAHFLNDEQGRTRWQIVDLDSGERWGGSGSMRHISADGLLLSIQSPNPYTEAEKRGEQLSPEDVAAVFLDYEADRTLFRISVADMLRVHPEGDRIGRLHLGIKKPLFSPDGKHISFVVTNEQYRAATAGGTDEPRQKDLFLANADGRNLRFLAPFVTHPSWHPTGRTFCALVRDPEDRLAFGQFPLDGSDPVYLHHPALRGGHPSIQPVYNRYVANDQFNRERGVAELWLYRLDDWKEQLVLEADYSDYSNDSGTHLHPAWSPDGRSLFINSAHPGHSQVYRVDVE